MLREAQSSSEKLRNARRPSERLREALGVSRKLQEVPGSSESLIESWGSWKSELGSWKSELEELEMRSSGSSPGSWSGGGYSEDFCHLLPGLSERPKRKDLLLNPGSKGGSKMIAIGGH